MAGDNVKLKLKNIEEEDVSPGFVLCDPKEPCKVGKRFLAQVKTPSTRGSCFLTEFVLFLRIVLIFFSGETTFERPMNFPGWD